MGLALKPTRKLQPEPEPIKEEPATRQVIRGDIPENEKCRHCWDKFAGHGRAYTSVDANGEKISANIGRRKRYYKCHYCGLTWIAIVRPEDVPVMDERDRQKITELSLLRK